MRVRLEIQLLEIFEAYKTALLADNVGMTCPYMGGQRDNFSGFFGGPEGLSYLQLQKMICEKSL